MWKKNPVSIHLLLYGKNLREWNKTMCIFYNFIIIVLINKCHKGCLCGIDIKYMRKDGEIFQTSTNTKFRAYPLKIYLFYKHYVFFSPDFIIVIFLKICKQLLSLFSHASFLSFCSGLALSYSLVFFSPVVFFNWGFFILEICFFT